MQNSKILSAMAIVALISAAQCSIALNANGSEKTQEVRKTPSDASADAPTAKPATELKAPVLNSFETSFYGSAKTAPRHDACKQLLVTARKQFNQGQLVAAYKSFKRVLQMDGPPVEPYSDRAMAYCGLVDCYAKEGNFSYAEQVLNNATQLMSGHRHQWKTQFQLARLRLAQGKKQEAEQEMLKAIEMCDSGVEKDVDDVMMLRQQLALFYVDCDRFEDAEKQLRIVAAHEPETENALNVRTAIPYYLAKQGKDEESEKESESLCAAILKMKNVNAQERLLPLAARNRAVVLRRLGQEAAAAEWEAKGAASEAAWNAKAKTRREPDFGKYMVKLQRKIKKNWVPPRDLESKRVVIKFKVDLNGEMSDCRVSVSSGLDKADKAALSAVMKSAPFDPLPEGTEEAEDIQFTFDYNSYYGHGGGTFRQF